jgi:hypothetical protein
MACKEESRSRDKGCGPTSREKERERGGGVIGLKCRSIVELKRDDGS